MLPPTKNAIEFTPRAVERRPDGTTLVTMVASGVFTNPNPRPINPAYTLIHSGSPPDPEERPITPANITIAPVTIKFESVIRPSSFPAATPDIADNIALGSITTPIASTLDPLNTVRRIGRPTSSPAMDDIRRKLETTSVTYSELRLSKAGMNGKSDRFC
jgi:hypothetical protein